MCPSNELCVIRFDVTDFCTFGYTANITGVSFWGLVRKKEKSAKCSGYVARTKVRCRLNASWVRCWAND